MTNGGTAMATVLTQEANQKLREENQQNRNDISNFYTAEGGVRYQDGPGVSVV